MLTKRFGCSSRSRTRLSSASPSLGCVADNVDTATRSRIMSRVRSKDTRPELTLRKALWAAGIRGWRCHVRSVPGTPDLCWRGRRVAVFLDSAWWHGHPSRWTPGRHPAAWDRKIAANRRRDEWVNRQLRDEGWTVVRVWDFELAADPDGVVARVYAAIRRGAPEKVQRPAAGRARRGSGVEL
jgi:DNA mismatch endonuclease, patch repair protein